MEESDGKPAELHIEHIKSQKSYMFAKTIPQHPARLLLIGSSQLSGKTTVFLNLLGKRFPFKKFYGKENIYCMVPTIHHDKRWHKLGLDKENFSDKWDPDWITEVVGKVNDRKVPSLFIFDDIIPIGGGEAKNQPFYELFTKGRWQGVSRAD